MNTDSIAQKALRKAAERLTPELRNKAIMVGWPPYIVEELTVEVNESDGEFYVDYPENLAQQIEDLEYGTQKRPGNPVIRPFMYLHNENTADIYESAFEDIAMTLGAFN